MKNFFKSAIISALLVALAFSAVGLVYAYDWQSQDFDWGFYDSVVSSWVAGDFGGSSLFDHAYFGSGRDPGDANYLGYLWFWWTVDTDEIEWYTAGDWLADDGAVEAQFLSCESLSWFYYGALYWPCEAYASEGYPP